MGQTPGDDATERFTDRAHDYARYRPGYPAEVIDAIVGGLAGERLTAADVGAGTGISARLLAELGVDVVAVEPNAAMRASALAHPRVTWRDGTAERTGLAGGSVDLVLVAQAFHWFDPPRALREFHRILRPGGRLAIAWNRRSRTDPFTVGYGAALVAIDGEAPAERSTFDPGVVAATGWFTSLREHAAEHRHELTLDELLGRALSTSTVPKAGPRHDELLRLLRALHARHARADGGVVMVYRTVAYLWDRA